MMLTPTKSDTVAHTTTRLPGDEVGGGSTGAECGLACEYCDWPTGSAIGMGCECDDMMGAWSMRCGGVGWEK